MIFIIIHLNYILLYTETYILYLWLWGTSLDLTPRAKLELE